LKLLKAGIVVASTSRHAINNSLQVILSGYLRFDRI